jgi:predicted nuclease of predicted toxin-antitoxin system
VRFLADECLVGQIVRRLRTEAQDVDWIRESDPGASDNRVLDRSYRDARILLTHDWGFGDLVVRLGKPATGVVIVTIAPFEGDLDGVASDVTMRLMELGEGLRGQLTIMQGRRTRQRKLLQTG